MAGLIHIEKWIAKFQFLVVKIEDVKPEFKDINFIKNDNWEESRATGSKHNRREVHS